jgi:hypothetical protein
VFGPYTKAVVLQLDKCYTNAGNSPYVMLPVHRPNVIRIAGEDEAASERPSGISSTTSLLVLRPMSNVFTLLSGISPRFTTGYCRCTSPHDAPDWQSTSIRSKVGCRKALSRRPVSDVDDNTRRTPDSYRKYLRHKMFENQSRQRPGSRAAGLAMALKLIEAARTRWRAVNAPHPAHSSEPAPSSTMHTPRTIHRRDTDQTPNQPHQRRIGSYLTNAWSTGHDNSCRSGSPVQRRGVL